MIRDDIKTATITAMKAGEKERTATLRMISAKIKDRDIEARMGKAPDDDDALVTEVLQKMIKQRRDSITMYRDGGREELAAKEEFELALIEEFMPAQMNDDDISAAIAGIKAEVGAESIKDMGKVMGQLKTRFAGQMDMGKASGMVKASFG